ncbi:phosphate-starvation-inducible PsiE family protein [uncultured Rhodospira sp.]|uniref:phosphate-starvation-inducible PsiE family protein n=1 Tax=uncultured Rhodospira sp. TaxID=1936189 RepID=UPI00262F7996|nr:phosphate-starvation-inducible PsiE family protein [uncultured Rhodospira sp.]
MIQITYASTATTPMSTADLRDILTVSRRYNAAHGITGMLLYHEGTFLQVLEGEEPEVEALVDRLSTDSRHTDVTILERKTVTEREYPDWSMGFKKLSSQDLSNIADLEGFDESKLSAVYLASHNNVLKSLMRHFRAERRQAISEEELPTEELSLDEPDRLINILHRVIRFSVRILAVLMVFSILWGIVDVANVLYQEILAPVATDFEIRDIIVTFGAFLTVLIAIEIFVNITLYLRDDVLHIRLVVSTALMAIARKVIILDLDKIEPSYMFAIAAIVIALGITYWLVGERTIGQKPRRTRSA